MFTRRFHIIAAAFLIATGAWAQSDGPVRFDIPFDFNIGDRQLAAGRYEVAASPGNPILRVRTRDGYTVWMGVTHALTTRDVTSASQLVFNKYGDRYFMSKVRVAGTDGGRQLFPSRQERELARTATLARATLTAARRSSQ